jgi:GT2 family glycosyltransferase
VDPTVSIIIPNWNGGDTLENCLRSILDHTREVDFELIVIDNGSSDGSPSTLRELASHDARVRVEFNEENLLFARACNQGYELSRGRYILIANNDILLQDDAVSTLVAYAEGHTEVGIVTPRFCDREGSPQEFYRRLPNVLYLLAHYHRLGRAIDKRLLGQWFGNRYFYRDRTFLGVEEVEQPGASFSLLRRTVIDHLGLLFDERFPLLFNDVDLSKRVKESGFSSHVLPDLDVIHLEGVSSRKFDPARYQHLQFSGMFEYFRKYHPIQYALLCIAWPQWWTRIRRTATSSVGKY